MKVRHVLKSALAAMACTGTLIPQTNLAAADAAPERRTQAVTAKSQAKKSQAKMISDIQLDRNSRLTGVLVDTNGKLQALKKVVVRQGKRTVAITKTDRNGRFTVSRLRGGVYQIATEHQVATVRVWANGTAPPKAKTALLLVTGNVARGQGFIPMGTITGGLGLAAGIAGLTLAVVNLDDIDDLESQVNRLRNSLR